MRKCADKSPASFVLSGRGVAAASALSLLTLNHRSAWKRNSRKSTFTDLYSPHPSGRVSNTTMGDFFSDLKSILGLRMLGEVVLGMRRNDLLGIAGQLAYFFLL